MSRERGARFLMGREEKLFLGVFETRHGEIGQIAFDRTIIRMARDSSFAVSGRVHIGPGVRIILGPNAQFSVGDGTHITANSMIVCSQAVTIGSNCAISWDVLIMDTNPHTVIEHDLKKRTTAPITICDRVWIGAGSKILKGVTIGEGSIIGAGAVVTKDVPPECLVVGNPGKVVRSGVHWIP